MKLSYNCELRVRNFCTIVATFHSELSAGLFCESLNTERTILKRKSIRCFRNANREVGEGAK